MSCRTGQRNTVYGIMHVLVVLLVIQVLCCGCCVQRGRRGGGRVGPPLAPASGYWTYRHHIFRRS